MSLKDGIKDTASSLKGIKWSRIVLHMVLFIFVLLPVIVRIGAETASPWLVPMDSQWQEGNGCMRILAGQLPGRDFQVFHGIACVWIHMPFFLLAGCGENAVAFSHYTTCALMVLFMLKVAYGAERRGWLVAAVMLSLASAMPLLKIVVDPLFNMSATRSAMGITAIILITNLPFRGGKWASRLIPPMILAMVLAGFHDQGPIVALAFIARALVELARRRTWPASSWAWAASGLLIFPAVEWLLCAGRPEEMRMFHWRDLMSTQIWFWAPTQNFLQTPSDLLFLVDRQIIIALFMHLMGWFLVRYAGDKHKGIQWSLLLYGLASLMPMLGMLVPNYFIGMGLSGLASVACGLGYQAQQRRSLGVSALPDLIRKAHPSLTFGAALIVIGVASVRTYQWAKKNSSYMRNSDTAVEAHVAVVEGDRKLWSFYRSMIDYRVGADYSEAEDLIIYAVGTARSAAYAGKLIQAKPLFVNTPAETEFSDWLSIRYWQANRHVLCHYRPVCREGMWATWRRRDQHPTQIVEADWTEGQLFKQGEQWIAKIKEMDSPVDQPVLWEGRLIHRRISDGITDGVANRLRRWVVRAPEGRPVVLPFALDPSTTMTEMVFPVVRRDPGAVELSIKPEGLWPAGTLEIMSVDFRPVLGADPADLPIMLPQAASGRELKAAKSK